MMCGTNQWNDGNFETARLVVIYDKLSTLYIC